MIDTSAEIEKVAPVEDHAKGVGMEGLEKRKIKKKKKYVIL